MQFFFYWCSVELNDEKDLVIFQQRRKIMKVKSSLKETKKWLKLFIAMCCFLVLVNAILMTLMWNIGGRDGRNLYLKQKVMYFEDDRRQRWKESVLELIDIILKLILVHSCKILCLDQVHPYVLFSNVFEVIVDNMDLLTSLYWFTIVEYAMFR